ncbi:MAG TPA: YggT family protein [Steroidobacteraceae bacterium]|jgi:YggT family protein|nr:YggT family protein [Steroidobacteraceae bacterium]
MIALHYLVDALLTIYLYVLILRFVMQLVRADFRNQIAHAVLIVTNPLIMPLRKILPPVGKVDTSSVIAILIVAALIVAAAPLILQGAALDPITWIRWTLLLIARSFITFYTVAIIIYVILGWVLPPGYSPPMALLASVCEPVLAPVRRLIPPIGGIDFSPLWVSLAFGVILRLLPVV